MAYVRPRGNQLLIVHGVRTPGSGKVEQQILFTIYSKEEAREIVSKNDAGHTHFESLFESRYPDLKLNWKTIRRSIQENLAVLPDHYEFRTDRVRSHFRKDLTAFARQLMLVDPQDLMPSAQLLEEHHHELEYLAELIQWRLKLRDQKEGAFNSDNRFYWRFELQGKQVPMDTEEHAASFYERGEYDKARAIFQLLVEAFDDYAEGHNYLGLIAYQLRQFEVAIAQFEKTVAVGRKQFPRSLGKRSFWADHRTRPFMRGLLNLALSLNEAGRFDDALNVCAQFERETGDLTMAASSRAAVLLNTSAWGPAVEAAQASGENRSPFVEALALFELGNSEKALRRFVRGALLYPRAARSLVGLKPESRPTSREEGEDHNLGIALLRQFHEFLRTQSRASKAFFRSVMKDARFERLLREVQEVTLRWLTERSATDRRTFERMTLMQSDVFAEVEAGKMLDLVRAPPRGALLH